MFSISAVLQPDRVVAQMANVKATLLRNFMSDLKYRFVNDIPLKVTLADAPLHFVPASVNQLRRSCNNRMRGLAYFEAVKLGLYDDIRTVRQKK
ncbi:hypothetical protein [Pararhizobium polonicum]|uniref:hypothetical protein n=1 Tax=Pararhizobium polonicum TaxID=1612624 RepID=UPI0013966DA1|nr:hypothetical protein [Pararhizobium polonicum]